VLEQLSDVRIPLRFWLRFIGVEFWLVGLVPFQIGFIVGAQAWTSTTGLLGLATVALLTSSSFVLNHICDLETDRQNPRKAFSLLVRGDIAPLTGWVLFGALQLVTLTLAAFVGREFLFCLLGLTAISLAYNIAPLRLKERPGVDIVANGVSLGFLLPLAGWSLSQPLTEFPRLYFASIICYLVAFYCPTMAVDVAADRAVGTTTFATRFGALATMRLSWIAMTFGAAILFWSGLSDIFPWDRNLLWWTGWILAIQPVVHWQLLSPNKAPDYETVRRGSICLATIAAFATLVFLWLYLSGSPEPPFRR